jgi:predicted transposase YbfD/YdcC
MRGIVGKASGGCQTEIAAAIVDHGADYLLATKDNQKTARAEIELYFDTAPKGEIEASQTVEKNHGRIETRSHRVSHNVAWMTGRSRYPDEPKFKNIKMIAMVEAIFESGGQTKTERRFYISSRALTASEFASAARNHWAIENSLHWVLDVQFGEDQSRIRSANGPKNMAVVRHFSINLIRLEPSKRSSKGKRKLASWDNAFLAKTLGLTKC